MSLNNQIKDFFTYNRSERNGVFVLLCILVILITINFCLPLMMKPEPANYSEFQAMIDSFNTEDQVFPITKTDSNDHESNQDLFPFDPNNLPKEKWYDLGLSEKQVSVIQNYLKAGGKFRVKEDLKKIYSISDKLYDQLEPFITIIKSIPIKSHVKSPESVKVEVNSADSTDLIRLKGIGPVFSARIIKYRNLLGGYYSHDQLLEVYGFDKTKLNLIRDQAYFNPDLIKKIKINTAGFKELIKHPYISYKLTKTIFNYREDSNSIIDNELLRVILCDDDSLRMKLEPYLEY